MNRSLHRWMVLLVALLAACTPARKEVEGNIARRIRFEGNGGLLSGHNDLQLRNQMEQDNTSLWVTVWPFLYWIDPEILRVDLLQRDAYRLEVWYAHNGWFDARVWGWELREIRRETPEKAGVYDIWGYVEPGPPSLVRAYDVIGLPQSLRVLERTLRAEASLEEGQQFELDDVVEARTTLLRLLQNQSHAYATVDSDIRAYPQEQAVDVSFVVEPGISTVYGPVELTGHERIDEEDIRAVIPIEPGQPYKLDDLALTRQRLFQMSTFSIVTVEPDLSDPTSEVVPIEVSVSESRFQRVRLGGGAEVKAGTIQPRASAQYQHVNLFDELIRFDAEATLGAAVLFGAEQSDFEWTYSLGATATYPRFAGERFDLELAASYERDVYAGLWVYTQPEADLRVLWRPTDNLALRIGPHVERYEILHLDEEAEDQLARVFGTGTTFVNPYTLVTLDQSLTADFRDDPISTTRGWFANFTLREALPILEDGYAFVGGSAEGRFFRPIRFSRSADRYPVIFASKARLAHVQEFSRLGVPYQQLEFLGGAQSIRGFRPRQVGPYDTLCSIDEDGEVEHFFLPLGGTTSAEGTVELRFPWKQNLTLATFADAGVLERDITRLGFEDVRWSVGVGGRYETLIGPLRLDVSFRPLYPEDEGPRQVINCRPGDDVVRDIDIFDALFTEDRGDKRPPFAMVFYLAIGEAL